MAAVGAVLNAIVSNLSVESVVYGAVMGLASTGLHQGFKSFVEGTNDDGIYHINVSDYVALFIHYIDMGRMEVSAGGGDTLRAKKLALLLGE